MDIKYKYNEETKSVNIPVTIALLKQISTTWEKNYEALGKDIVKASREVLKDIDG